MCNKDNYKAKFEKFQSLKQGDMILVKRRCKPSIWRVVKEIDKKIIILYAAYQNPYIHKRKGIRYHYLYNGWTYFDEKRYKKEVQLAERYYKTANYDISSLIWKTVSIVRIKHPQLLIDRRESKTMEITQTNDIFESFNDLKPN